MYYKELLKICNNNGKLILSNELMEAIDTWLYMLPDNLADKITVGRFSKNFNIDFNLSRAILEKLHELKVLKRLFVIRCPECGHLLKVTDEDNMVLDMLSIKYCYKCNQDELEINKENIEVRYKLIVKHYDPDKTKFLCDEIMGDCNNSGSDTIQDIIDKSNYNVNNLFYNPTVEQRKELNNLCCGVKSSSENTTAKGTKFEDFVYYMLSLVRTFNVTKAARTDINQIDCLAINKLPFTDTILGEIGSILYCECKNEKHKPGNTYFHKIHSIMQLTQTAKKERRFGIVFSIEPAPSTIDKLSKIAFSNNNIMLINFNYSELVTIVEEDRNFLDEVDKKAKKIIHRITKDLESLGL